MAGLAPLLLSRFVRIPQRGVSLYYFPRPVSETTLDSLSGKYSRLLLFRGAAAVSSVLNQFLPILSFFSFFSASLRLRIFWRGSAFFARRTHSAGRGKGRSVYSSRLWIGFWRRGCAEQGACVTICAGGEPARVDRTILSLVPREDDARIPTAAIIPGDRVQRTQVSRFS
jgi:hypothetical protein